MDNQTINLDTPATTAATIRANWTKVYFGAEPYLNAMAQMDSWTAPYMMDPASSVFAYALSNMTGFRGEVARTVKAEMKKHL